MKHKTHLLRLTALLICLCLALGLGGPAMAETGDLTAEEKADALFALGLFRGKGTLADGSPDYALEDSASRCEAATMLIRLLGQERKAGAQFAAGALKDPFSDLPAWAEANVSWLYAYGYVNGVGGDKYGGAGTDTVTAQQFAAMILRSLGYRESAGDFTYAGALDYAVQKGLLTSAQRSAWAGDFRRAGMAEMCYNALYANMRNSQLTLKQKLTNDGVFRPAANIPAASAPLTLSLKYKGGGSIDKWTVEEPVGVSPLCADLDGDGKTEIVYTYRSVYCLDGATGKVKWFVPSGHDITEGLKVMDIYSADYTFFGTPTLAPKYLDVDGDGAKELITFHNDRSGHTFVGVYDGSGRFKGHFTTNERVTAAHIADLDGDGKCEFALGAGVGAGMRPSLTLRSLDGSVLPGWPKVQGYGLYSDSITSLDLDGDGKRELVLLYDEEHVAAYHPDGSEVIASGGAYAGVAWGGLPVCENADQEEYLADWAKNHSSNHRAAATSDLVFELRGRSREVVNCIMGTYGGVTAADVDGNGSTELVFTCMVVDGSLVMRNDGNTFDGIARYFTTFILNRDRTRYANPALGYDWRQMPTDTGEIRGMGAENIAPPDNAPVCADLDGDGMLEILYSSHDGRVHCCSLDGTEHGAWPYALSSRTDGDSLTFASRPVTADLNGDGRPEVIFTTYTESDQVERRGSLYVLDGQGRLLASAVLPPMWGFDTLDKFYANGSPAAPAAADVDGDGRPEIVVTTLSCGVCVYDVG